MVDYLDLNSLFDQARDLYDQNNYNLAKSYFIQARNLAVQMENINALKVDLKPFRTRCNCFIGKCQEKLEVKIK